MACCREAPYLTWVVLVGQALGGRALSRGWVVAKEARQGGKNDMERIREVLGDACCVRRRKKEREMGWLAETGQRPGEVGQLKERAYIKGCDFLELSLLCRKDQRRRQNERSRTWKVRCREEGQVMRCPDNDTAGT